MQKLEVMQKVSMAVGGGEEEPAEGADDGAP